MRYARCSMTSSRLSDPKMALNLLTDANVNKDQKGKKGEKKRIRSALE